MQRKYTVIIFFDDRKPIRLRMVKRDFRSLPYWLERNGLHCTAMNVYDRSTREFITQLQARTYWYQIDDL